MTEAELQELIAKSTARLAEISEQAAHWKAQRRSFARAEAAFGSDAEESEFRAAYASNDPARIAVAAQKEAERLARFNRMYPMRDPVNAAIAGYDGGEE